MFCPSFLNVLLGMPYLLYGSKAVRIELIQIQIVSVVDLLMGKERFTLLDWSSLAYPFLQTAIQYLDRGITIRLEHPPDPTRKQWGMRIYDYLSSVTWNVQFRHWMVEMRFTWEKRGKRRLRVRLSWKRKFYRAWDVRLAKIGTWGIFICHMEEDIGGLLLHKRLELVCFYQKSWFSHGSVSNAKCSIMQSWDHLN